MSNIKYPEGAITNFAEMKELIERFKSGETVQIHVTLTHRTDLPLVSITFEDSTTLEDNKVRNVLCIQEDLRHYSNTGLIFNSKGYYIGGAEPIYFAFPNYFHAYAHMLREREKEKITK
jgi:hypothetical protein